MDGSTFAACFMVVGTLLTECSSLGHTQPLVNVG